MPRPTCCSHRRFGSSLQKSLKGVGAGRFSSARVGFPAALSEAGWVVQSSVEKVIALDACKRKRQVVTLQYEVHTYLPNDLLHTSIFVHQHSTRQRTESRSGFHLLPNPGPLSAEPYRRAARVRRPLTYISPELEPGQAYNDLSALRASTIALQRVIGRQSILTNWH